MPSTPKTASRPSLPDVTQAEGEQVLEPGQGGGYEQLGEPAAEAVKHDGDVLVLVGVDAGDDITAPQLHAGHGPWVSFTDPSVYPLAGRADRTAMRPWSSQAPIRSLPVWPAAWRIVAAAVDTSTPRHPRGRS